MDRSLYGKLNMTLTNILKEGGKYENKLCKDVENCDEQAYCNTNGDKCVFNIQDDKKIEYLDRFAKELTYNQYKRYEFIENKYFINYDSVYKEANSN